MTIFRNKENGLLYTIEHLVLDIRFTNNNEFSGVYCKSYKHNSDVISFKNKNHDFNSNL